MLRQAAPRNDNRHVAQPESPRYRTAIGFSRSL
jgi:hypothetical protein